MFKRSKLLKLGFVFINLFFFLSSACAHRQALRVQEKDPIPIHASIKIAGEGKISVDKKLANAVNYLPEGNLYEGKCIYGCPDQSMPEKKRDEKPVSLSTPTLPVTGPLADWNGGSQDYILGSEDVIDVSVWKNETLSRVVSIRPDGKISLPLVGDIQAAGLTTSQLRDSIKERLKDYKENPEVSIIVKEVNSLVVFISGEVNRPGKLILKSDTTILQAIISAGGFSQFASSNKIVLLRRVGGLETRKLIHYQEIVSGKRPDDDIMLQRGDTIIVP